MTIQRRPSILKMMFVFLNLCFTALAALLSDTEGILSEVCVPAQQNNVLVPLSGCEDNTIIHVVQEVTGLATNTCTLAISPCINVRDSSELTVNCNGLRTCQESVSIKSNMCNSSQFAAVVNFDCVEGNMDICSLINSVKEGPVYLHSPGFPDSFNLSGDCSCNITGSQMTVELLELYSTQVVDISADGVQVWPFPRELSSQFNRELVGPGASMKMTDNVSVTYRTKNTTSRQNVWLKVSGTGGLRVECSGDRLHLPSSPLPATTPLTTTKATTAVTSPTTSSTNNADSSSTSSSTTTRESTIDSVSGSKDASTATIIAVVLGVIVCILLAIIIIGVIYIKRIRNGRNSTKREHENEGEIIAQYEVPPRVYDDIQEPSRDPNNIYNGLYLNLDEPTAHDYRDIHEYYNTRHTPEIPTGYI